MRFPQTSSKVSPHFCMKVSRNKTHQNCFEHDRLLNSKKGRACGRKIDHNLQKSDDNDGTGKKLCD